MTDKNRSIGGNLFREGWPREICENQAQADGWDAAAYAARAADEQAAMTAPRERE